MSGKTFNICTIPLLALLMISCSGGQSPMQPDSQQAISGGVGLNANSAYGDGSSHRLIGWFEVYADASRGTLRPLRVRTAADHINVAAFLERSPCDDCLRIEKMEKSADGTWLVDVTVENPFSNPDLTAFDVRGIVMFTAGKEFPSSGVRIASRALGDGELLNADGYTSLYNSATVGNGTEGYYRADMATATSPESTVNGFKRHITADPSNTRNAFYAGDNVTVSYHLSLPDTPFVFGYAVDANWAPPLKSPVENPMEDFPMEANCPEPWKIALRELAVGGGLTSEGGSTIIQMDVYDHQGYDSVHLPRVECPELFDGLVQAVYRGTGIAYTRYEAVIENEKLVYGGDFTCLIRIESAENDPVNKPWLDLSAWQLFDAHVEPITEPGEITPNGFMFAGDIARSIRISGNYACVMLKNGDIHIFDISDPVYPIWISVLDTDKLTQFEVSDGFAYTLTEFDDSLSIYDIDPPESAHRVFRDSDYSGNTLDIVGDYCYLLDDTYLRLIDISVPNEAFEADSISIPQAGENFTVRDGYAYVFADDFLQIIDIEPFSMAHIVRIIPIDLNSPRMNVVDGFLHLGNLIIDIDPPSEAQVIGHMPNYTGYQKLWNGWLVDIYRDLTFYDISNPASPVPTYTLPCHNYIAGFDISGDYALVPGPGSAFRIIDLDPPAAVHVVRSITSVDAGIMSMGDGYIYILDVPDDIFSSIDIEPPGLAHLQSVFKDIRGNDIAYYENHIYIASGDIDVYDVSGPGHPTLIQTIDFWGRAKEIWIRDDKLYVRTYHTIDWGWESTLWIVDIRDPYSPEIFGSVSIVPPRCFDVEGDYAVAYGSGTIGYTGHYSDFDIISVNPPESAQVVGELDPDLFSGINGLKVHNGYVYVTSYEDWIAVVDIDPPDSASIVNSMEISDPQAMYIADDKLYVACYNRGIFEIDISTPETATIVRQYLEGETFGQMIIDGDYLYTTENEDWGRIRIFKLW